MMHGEKAYGARFLQLPRLFPCAICVAFLSHENKSGGIGHTSEHLEGGANE